MKSHLAGHGYGPWRCTGCEHTACCTYVVTFHHAFVPISLIVAKTVNAVKPMINHQLNRQNSQDQELDKGWSELLQIRLNRIENAEGFQENALRLQRLGDRVVLHREILTTDRESEAVQATILLGIFCLRATTQQEYLLPHIANCLLQKWPTTILPLVAFVSSLLKFVVRSLILTSSCPLTETNRSAVKTIPSSPSPILMMPRKNGVLLSAARLVFKSSSVGSTDVSFICANFAAGSS
jgi:hypothetical protein